MFYFFAAVKCDYRSKSVSLSCKPHAGDTIPAGAHTDTMHDVAESAKVGHIISQGSI